MEGRTENLKGYDARENLSHHQREQVLFSEHRKKKEDKLENITKRKGT